MGEETVGLPFSSFSISLPSSQNPSSGQPRTTIPVSSKQAPTSSSPSDNHLNPNPLAGLLYRTIHCPLLEEAKEGSKKRILEGMEEETEGPKKKRRIGGTGRKKIAMKKIDKKETLNVTFSKRKAGLFKKANELSVLCGVNVCILGLSPAGNPFAFGDPPSEFGAKGEEEEQQPWWDVPIEGMGLDELEDLLPSMETLQRQMEDESWVDSISISSP